MDGIGYGFTLLLLSHSHTVMITLLLAFMIIIRKLVDLHTNDNTCTPPVEAANCEVLLDARAESIQVILG